MDKVELAFRKFDTNKDGYLSRDEFDQVTGGNVSIVSGTVKTVSTGRVHVHYVVQP